MLVCYSLHSDYPDIIYSDKLFHQRKKCKDVSRKTNLENKMKAMIVWVWPMQKLYKNNNKSYTTIIFNAI